MHGFSCTRNAFWVHVTYTVVTVHGIGGDLIMRAKLTYLFPVLHHDTPCKYQNTLGFSYIVKEYKNVTFGPNGSRKAKIYLEFVDYSKASFDKGICPYKRQYYLLRFFDTIVNKPD